MTKLAIVDDREEDKYEHKTVIKCWKCNPETGLELPEAVTDAHTKTLVDGIMQSLSSARQSEVKAWEEEIAACEHTLMLEQVATGHIQPSGTSTSYRNITFVLNNNGYSSLYRPCSLYNM